MNAPSIVQLDRKLTRAAELGKGVRIEAADLDLLVSLGLLDLTHRAKSSHLKEQSESRDARRRSLQPANTGSPLPIGQREPAAAKPRATMPARDVSAARRRVGQGKAERSTSRAARTDDAIVSGTGTFGKPVDL